jgi:hypothetical protein
MIEALVGQSADLVTASSVVVGASFPSGIRSVGHALSSLRHNTHAVGAAWMISSAIFTTYSTTKFLKYEAPNKDLLLNPATRKSGNAIPRPALLTLYRFAGSLFLGLTLHPDLGSLITRLRTTILSVPAFLIPALFLFVANFTNTVALDRIGISLTYTSKCAIPLITVVLTILLDGWGALPNSMALLSLVPIAFGIAAASWNSPTFETIGFVAAMISATAQSALAVTSKRVMEQTNVTGPAAQRVMVLVGLVMAVCMTLIHQEPPMTLVGWSTTTTTTIQQHGGRNGIQHPKRSDAATSSAHPPAWLSLAAMVAYHFEYCLSFLFVKMVQPITYGACDAVRRLAIIMCGRILFHGAPPTLVNLAGIALALAGALAYSITSSLTK